MRANAAGEDLIEDVLSCLEDDKPVRRELGAGGRVHIDRGLPFLCLHSTDRSEHAARDVVTSNAGYIVAPDLAAAVPIINAISRFAFKRHGAFLVVEVGELEHDRMAAADSPYLPPFDIVFWHENDAAGIAAAGAFTRAVQSVDAKYRSPQMQRRLLRRDDASWSRGLDPDVSRIRICFAPIYRQPESERIYPELRQRLVANVYDAVLQAVAAFLAAKDILRLPTHRALGRRVFADTVRRVDARVDSVANSFDFLLAVTPINAEHAWHEFRSAGFAQAPRFLYRPLTVEIDVAKRRLFAIPFDDLEDPLLYDLYREKQEELDLQLTLVATRGSPRFRELSRALYGPVEPELLEIARDVLARTDEHRGSRSVDSGHEGSIDCHALAREARRMVAGYRAAGLRFAARVEVRDDLPAGMMVSGPRLLIARSTSVARSRVEPLLSHEIGVHLFTYFAGDAQGLRLFRTGLAGYEGVQEGLGVFAEYLVGGMTVGRLRLIAARVLGCAAMLDGATFAETCRLLARDHGYSDAGAYGIALRVYRSGGLSKDAIYLRGLLLVLQHLERGGSLGPFWLGKIAAKHYAVMEELSARGFLKMTPVSPAFLSHPAAAARLEAARCGLSPVDLLAA